MDDNINIKEIDIDDFKKTYFHKKMLQKFCKDLKLSQEGSKLEIFERILTFLETGKILQPKQSLLAKKTNDKTLSLNTIIKNNFRCDLKHRIFFKSVIGEHFKFNVPMIMFAKKNHDKTYKDLVDHWVNIFNLKKSGEYKSEIHKSCEYNQFIRNFYSDTNNKGKKLIDAIRAWKKHKSNR
ncbi:MAG: hypothetical protein JXA94_03020 [Parachlamydiales bacterium]|nr:hypothetical protein [Parachlamydiales bacterium]